MTRFFISFALLVGLASFHPSENETYTEKPIASAAAPQIIPPVYSGESYLKSLFAQFPENVFCWEAFQYAMMGRQILMKETGFEKPDIITIVDFSKPSTQERLFVVDINEARILYSSLTSHGRNTGENMATSFSNTPESYQSSLGFYKTAEIYTGSKGYSMRLDGLEANINCRARARGIVVHAADYVSNNFAQLHGRLGRSQGCPALPKELNRPIIQKISGGSLFFIYAPNDQYRKSSRIFKVSDIHNFVSEPVSNSVQG